MSPPPAGRIVAYALPTVADGAGAAFGVLDLDVEDLTEVFLDGTTAEGAGVTKEVVEADAGSGFFFVRLFFLFIGAAEGARTAVSLEYSFSPSSEDIAAGLAETAVFDELVAAAGGNVRMGTKAGWVVLWPMKPAPTGAY